MMSSSFRASHWPSSSNLARLMLSSTFLSPAMSASTASLMASSFSNLEKTFEPDVRRLFPPKRGAVERKGTMAHFILKSSAASFALSMSRTVLALSLEAMRICRKKEKKKEAKAIKIQAETNPDGRRVSLPRGNN